MTRSLTDVDTYLFFPVGTNTVQIVLDVFGFFFEIFVHIHFEHVVSSGTISLAVECEVLPSSNAYITWPNSRVYSCEIVTSSAKALSSFKDAARAAILPTIRHASTKVAAVAVKKSSCESNRHCDNRGLIYSAIWQPRLVRAER